MKLFRFKRLAFALLLALGAAPALAADDSVPDILQTQHALREKLDNPGGEYSRISPDDLAKMRRAQDRIFQMLDGVTSFDELKDDQKSELSAELDEVKTTLAKNSGSRLVCYREHRPGTNVVEKRCETVQERKARSLDSE